MEEVKYQVDGKQVTCSVYSGRDSWSAPKYWTLLDSHPMFGRDLVIVPDKADGLTATLEGKVRVSIKIRGSLMIGFAETKRLSMIRKGKDSQAWYLSKKEMIRLSKLVQKVEQGEK